MQGVLLFVLLLVLAFYGLGLQIFSKCHSSEHPGAQELEHQLQCIAEAEEREKGQHWAT